MKKSALVDFYNLDLQKGEMLEIVTWPDKDERQQITDFFETYAPDVVKTLTPEKKQQLRNLFCSDKFKELEKKTKKALMSNDPEEVHKAPFDYKCNMELIVKEIEAKMDKAVQNNDDSLFNTVFVNGYTTLEGYEIVYGGSWFDGSHFKNFAVEYHHIKKLIDKNLDDDQCVTNADWNWLESRINMYTNAKLDGGMIGYHTKFTKDLQVVPGLIKEFLNNHWKEISQFGIPLGEIFPSIHKEAMSLLEGELDIDKCIICSKLFKRNKSNQIYCSPECRQAVDSRNKGKQSDKIHQELCELIDEWLGLKQESDWVDTLGLAGDLSKEFSIGFGYQNDLDRKNISEGLQWQFKDNGISLSDNATISIRDEGSRWLITDKNKTYIIKKEKGGLNIIRKTFLLDKKSPSKSLGSYLNKPKCENKSNFENKLEEEKKIIIQSRQKRKNKEYNFLRI